MTILFFRAIILPQANEGVREIGIEYLPEVLLIVLLALLAGINIGRLIAGWESREEKSDNSDDQSGNSQD